MCPSFCHVTLNLEPLEGSVPLIRTQKKFFSYFSDIWYIYRGRRLMHDGMPYDPIQRQGHELLQTHSRGVDRQSRTGLIFVIVFTRCRQLHKKG